MVPGSSGGRRHSAKRRKIDATDTIPAGSDRESRSDERKPRAEQPARLRKSPPSRPLTNAVPVVRPPDAPFHPGAIQLWVVRNSEGKKQLVSEMVPGCRHWRIGDPNVSFCFECKKEGDVAGCKTCKRSYHMACLGEDAPGKNTSTNVFYCPACIERGWNVQPPPEILPLTPASSRETSPAPGSANDAAVSGSRQQPEPLTVSQHIRYTHADPDQSNKNPQTSREGSATKAPATASDQMQSQQRPSQDHSTSFGILSGPLGAAQQQQEAVLNRLREDYSLASFRSAVPTDSAVNQTTAASRSNRAKSRYQTMPDEVDQALAVIYRELESVTALRQDIAAHQDRVRAAEQARQILEGRLALERSSREAVASKDAEIDSLKQHLAELRRSNELLVQENNALKQRMQDEQTSNKAGLEEMKALKASLRRLLGD